MNLTGVTSVADVVRIHFAESFFGAALLETADRILLDVGAGAGFPGLAMKLIKPQLHVYLVEPRKKKAAFLSTVRQELGLTDVTVIRKTIEQCLASDFPSPPSCLTLRAVTDPAKMVKQVLRMLNSAASTKTILFVTEAQLPEILSRLRQVDWRKPVPIPWTRQKLILTGVMQLPDPSRLATGA